MSARASRRVVLAAIALQADLHTPRDIAFVEDSGRIDIELDTVADLHTWLPFFGMTAKRVSAQPYTHKVGPETGKTTTLANALTRVGNEWRGWRVHLNALDPVGETDPELDDATAAQLREIAEVSS